MCNNVKQDLDHPQLWAGVRFFFQLVNFLSCPLLSTDLVFSSLRKSATAKGLCRRFTTYIYWAEKQLAALCPQLHCLPAGNGMHESFIRGGEPLSVVSDLEICIRTQTHRKTRHSSLVAANTFTHTRVAWPSVLPSFNQKTKELKASVLRFFCWKWVWKRATLLLHVFILCSSSLNITLTV